MTAIASLNLASAPSLSPLRLRATPSSNAFWTAALLASSSLDGPVLPGASLKLTSIGSPIRTRTSNAWMPTFSFSAVTL